MTKNNQSVAKALQIIEIMAAGNGPMRLQDISSKLHLPASTVLRFLGTLTQFSYVTQDPETLQYSLTMKFCRLGHLVSSQVRLRDIVRPFLIRLTEDYQESASLAVEEEQSVLYIDCVDGPDHMLRTLQRIGRVAPLHNTGVGKILLLDFSEDQLSDLAKSRGLEGTTRNTITNKASLLRELQKVRRQGFAVDNEECEVGVRCVAAPIRDYTGKIIAAVSMSGPISRMSPTKMNQIKEGITRTAAEITAALGYEADAELKTPSGKPAAAKVAAGKGSSAKSPGAGRRSSSDGGRSDLRKSAEAHRNGTRLAMANGRKKLDRRQ